MTPLRILKDRSVLITGHTGFKGSWLALELHRLGASVHGLSLPPSTEPSHYELIRLVKLLHTETLGDIRDRETVSLALKRSDPDIILHLAAQSTVRHAYDNPEETFSTNILGTVHLLDVLRSRGRPCVVLVVTSDKVYPPNDTSRAHTESDPIGGNEPYSASKAAAELVTQAFRQSYFLPEKLSVHGVKLASARAGNVVGGGDWAKDRIVVDAIRALTENRPIMVRNPHAIRPWQHITDVVHAYLTLVAAMCSRDDPELFSAWNLGPPAHHDVTVSDLVTTMCKAWGHGTWTNDSDPNAPFEAPTLRLDSTKASSKLGIHTRFSPKEAIEMTVEWYRAWHEGAKDIRGLSLRDLEAHIRAQSAVMTHPEAKRG